VTPVSFARREARRKLVPMDWYGNTRSLVAVALRALNVVSAVELSGMERVRLVFEYADSTVSKARRRSMLAHLSVSASA
jgi:hypothetical protein